ncbi:hypothetical protein Tco_1191199 [Tanacetum coccineum]
MGVEFDRTSLAARKTENLEGVQVVGSVVYAARNATDANVRNSSPRTAPASLQHLVGFVQYDDTGVKDLAFVFVVEGLRIRNWIKEYLNKTRFS